MPRHKRLNVAGGIYHVIARGLERREIFKDDADRSEFIRRLEKSLQVQINTLPGRRISQRTCALRTFKPAQVRYVKRHRIIKQLSMERALRSYGKPEIRL